MQDGAEISEDEERLPLYAAYTDEARYNVGRYRGLGLVTLPLANAAPLSNELRALIASSGMTELKWEKIRSGRGRLAAEKLINWVFEQTTARRLRIDALTWDVAENPQMGHSGYVGHHLRNLQHMYTYLLGSVLPRRWSNSSHGQTAPCWRIFPDEQNALDWPAIAAQSPHIERIIPSDSQREPLIQVADFFVGLAVFSRANYDDYADWLAQDNTLLEDMAPTSEDSLPAHVSGSLRQRCLILDLFYTQAKARSLGVSLRSQHGLKTYLPDMPITFSWYTPQG
jgi:hypothetical protein